MQVCEWAQHVRRIHLGFGFGRRVWAGSRTLSGPMGRSTAPRSYTAMKMSSVSVLHSGRRQKMYAVVAAMQMRLPAPAHSGGLRRCWLQRAWYRGLTPCWGGVVTSHAWYLQLNLHSTTQACFAFTPLSPRCLRRRAPVVYREGGGGGSVPCLRVSGISQKNTERMPTTLKFHIMR